MIIDRHTLIDNRYRIGRRLGEGGMAVVYLGHDLLLGRDVAIKTLRPQFAADPLFRSRFEREARAAASLSHPNIIDIFDVGEADGAAYIVMELVRGQSLKEIIAADAPFHPHDVAELLDQIGAALDYAHGQGYVHRDVKPANILVDGHGRARIADFGIARSLADADLTDHGAGFGTAAYLSPEQAEGLMATPASDIYSAGVLAYEMLTGTLPFHAETPLGLAMRHVHDAAPPPSLQVPGLAPEVDAVVLRALAKDPTRRWPSVVAFSRALRQPRKQASPPVLVATTTPSPARGSLVPTIAIVVLIVGALSALIWSGLRDLAPASVEETAPPVVIAPPAITGSVADVQEDDAAAAPTPEPQPDLPAIVPQQPDARVVPTIAPATNATTAETGVTVPNLVGLTISGATQALGPLGLGLVPAQPVFSDSIPPNAIAEQRPAPGALLPPGESVRVSLSRGPSPFAAAEP